MVEVASDKDSLGRSVRSMVLKLQQLIQEVHVAASQVALGAEHINGASQSLSSGATEQAASVEEIAISMNDIRTLAKNTAGNSAKANRLTGLARETAENGNQQMQGLVFSMGEISVSSQEIGKIIKVIDDIAFQTNLLALNAAVEAAPHPSLSPGGRGWGEGAGRHGKGFAVVAEEVRNLASRSAKAARATAELIENSNKKVEAGLSAVEHTAKALGDIVNHVVEAATLVSEIAIAGDEQARGIAQVSEGLGQIDHVTQQNTANAEETAAAAEELAAQAAHLRQLLSRFRLGIQSEEQLSGPAAPLMGASAPPPALPARIGGQFVKASDPVLKEAGPQAQDRAELAQARAGEKPAPQDKGPRPRAEDIIALDDKEFGKY